MESGEASISFNDNDEKCIDLAQLIGMYDWHVCMISKIRVQQEIVQLMHVMPLEYGK